MPNPPLDLSPLGFDVPVGEVSGPVVIQYEGWADPAVLELEYRDGATAMAKLTRTDKPNPTSGHRTPLDRTLGQVAVEISNARAVAAYQLPPGRALTRFDLGELLGRGVGALLLFALILLVLVVVREAVIAAPLVMAALAGIVAAVAWRPRRSGRGHVFRTVQGSYPVAELLSGRPEAAEARALVDEVKDTYGGLLSDIVYRIERPALFDAAVPTTRAFTAALLQWDSASTALSGAELATLAAEVRVTFDAARAHAETVGITHIPERDRATAQRAAKALRLAASTSNDSERTAARQQAVKLLATLALYYLPDTDETRTMLEGRRILALPGRRTQQ